MEGTSDQGYIHVASLDLSNAFISLGRRDITDGLQSTSDAFLEAEMLGTMKLFG